MIARPAWATEEAAPGASRLPPRNRDRAGPTDDLPPPGHRARSRTRVRTEDWQEYRGRWNDTPHWEEERDDEATMEGPGDGEWGWGRDDDRGHHDGWQHRSDEGEEHSGQWQDWSQQRREPQRSRKARGKGKKGSQGKGKRGKGKGKGRLFGTYCARRKSLSP